ncbi:MAG: cysteine desulfurase [Geminicoccus sp.]|nr:cysteine desulfurase [Geminicoccus sp.]
MDIAIVPILIEWLETAFRIAHVTTAIAWVGSSFYFIALDLGLRRDGPLPEKVNGEEWQVHGGGFYHVQKYNVAPPNLPEHLTWFKWESYSTWLTGFAMLVLIYYLGADLYLIDTNVLDIPIWVGILISLGSIALGWLFYDRLCKSRFGDDNTRLMIFLFLVLVALAWGYTQVFSGRAAMLHLGAATATIMSANVFMVIIPNQKIVTADLRAGREPDPKYGVIAKQRSTHNNYLTLPVLFLMLSNHYPLVFASKYNWLIASLVFLIGVCIRHFFNTRDARKGNPMWTWSAAFFLFAVVIALSIWPFVFKGDRGEALASTVSPGQVRLMSADEFDGVHTIITNRCTVCHAEQPAWQGLYGAPKGVVLEVPEQTALHAKRIYMQSAISAAMPPSNKSNMLPEERLLIKEWYEAHR